MKHRRILSGLAALMLAASLPMSALGLVVIMPQELAVVVAATTAGVILPSPVAMLQQKVASTELVSAQALMEKPAISQSLAMRR